MVDSKEIIEKYKYELKESNIPAHSPFDILKNINKLIQWRNTSRIIKEEDIGYLFNEYKAISNRVHDIDEHFNKIIQQKRDKILEKHGGAIFFYDKLLIPGDNKLETDIIIPNDIPEYEQQIFYCIDDLEFLQNKEFPDRIISDWVKKSIKYVEEGRLLYVRYIDNYKTNLFIKYKSHKYDSFLSHMWVKVKIDNSWVQLSSYIKELYKDKKLTYKRAIYDYENNNIRKILNLWEGFPYKYSNNNSKHTIIDYLRSSMDNYKYFISWLSHIIQNTDIKLKKVPLLYGADNEIIVKMIYKLIGFSNIKIIRSINNEYKYEIKNNHLIKIFLDITGGWSSFNKIGKLTEDVENLENRTRYLLFTDKLESSFANYNKNIIHFIHCKETNFNKGELIKELDNPNTIQSIFNYLHDYDIKGLDTNKKDGIVDFLKVIYANIISNFTIKYKNGDLYVKTKNIHDAYKEYRNTTGNIIIKELKREFNIRGIFESKSAIRINNKRHLCYIIPETIIQELSQKIG